MSARGISFKLIGGTLFILAVSLLISNSIMIAQEKRVLFSQLEAQGQAVAHAAAVSCVEPLLSRDYPVLETIAQSLSNNEYDITFVRIQRSDGHIAAESHATNSHDADERSVHEVYTAPVLLDREEIGTVQIGVSIARARALIDKQLASRARVAAFTFLVITMILVVVLKIVVTAPIQRLDSAARRLGSGDLESVITLDSNDELGRLASTMDKMRLDLQTRDKINRQNEKLRHADRMKDEFLSNMSHEIRTPITAILGLAGLLADKSLAASERAKFVKTISQNGHHLLGILNELLDVSKIRAGKITIEKMSVSPTEIVENVYDLLSARANEKGIILATELVGSIPNRVQTDPTRLRQILINLTGNAIKFTKEGSVRLVAQYFAGDEPHLQFDIIDSGIGMTPDQADRIFEPFSQADSSTTRKFGGTGLGLSLSRSLAELLGGSIELAATRPGEGSTFRATIAVDESDKVEAARPIECEDVASPSGPELLGIRILLAEDNKTLQLLASRLLQKAGADVTMVGNGQLAVDATIESQNAGEPFDVILMDMQMPVMDGYAATKRLRSASYPGAIIALTANASASDRQECLDAGCDDFASKPIDSAKLAAVIKGCLRNPAMPTAS